MSLIDAGDSVMLGEGVRLFEVRVPASLAGRRLADTGIGSRTGLSVVAVEAHGGLSSQLSADHVLPSGGTPLMLGSAGQRRRFAEAFEGR